MVRIFDRAWIAGVLVSALPLGTALAQTTDPLAGGPSAPSTMASGLVTVQSFTLNGADCPAQSATMVTLTDGGGADRALLKIDFPSPSASASIAAPATTDPLTPAPMTPAPAPTAAPTTNSAPTFQAVGANDRGSCTVAVQLAAASSTPANGVDFSVVGANAAVLFTKPNNQGQLSLQSQIRLNNAMSRQSTAQVGAAVMASATPQMQMVTLDNLAVRTGGSRMITLMANLQLQTRNGADRSSVALDDLTLDLRVRAERPNDPDGD